MFHPIDSYKENKTSKSKKSPPPTPTVKLCEDFKLGNMATALVDYTLDICGKDEDKTPRFPSRLYDSYVSELIRSAVSIHREVCYANAVRNDVSRRKLAQEKAIGEAVNLEHLILSAYHKGWISSKQHLNWHRKICDLHFGIINWMSK